MWGLALFFACSSELASTPEAPSAATPEQAAPETALTPIRIGWQTTWATQGQLALILQQTEILREHGLEASWVGFSYGGPLNEGALAGEVDALFTADQPAIALASRSPDWGVAGRLMYNRVGTFVPPDSPLKSAADLAGKRVAVPFGAAAHREALGAAERAGIAPDSLQLTNLGLQEIVALVGAGAREGRWGELDAAAAWDPAFADLEERGAVRTLDEGRVTAVVVMSRSFLQEHPGASQALMSSLSEAYDFYREDPLRPKLWFLEAAQLPFNPKVLDRAEAVEPNLRPDAELRVTLSQEDLERMQQAADFMHSAELLKEPFSVQGMLLPGATP